MKRFIQKYAQKIIGVIKGFDRLVFRGTLLSLVMPSGMDKFLSKNRILLKDFDAYAERTTALVKAASHRTAAEARRPVQYVESSEASKEAIAREIAERDGVQKGLIAVLTCVERCNSFQVYRNRAAKILELRPTLRKCLHLYHYFIHPLFGFMYARLQTWFPFTIQIGMNGREFLARQMDRVGLKYHRQENCFPRIEDFDLAQKLMDRLSRVAWPTALDRIAHRLNPHHQQIFKPYFLDYYWSIHQSEWATDLAFRSEADLAEIYPRLVQHAMTSFSSPDIMRFLGRRGVHGNFEGEAITTLKRRPEGVRIKHQVGQNSVKMYDKFGIILRFETSIQDPRGFKVYRPVESQKRRGRKKLAWQALRKGVADLYRRTEVSQASNERYLDALAVVDTDRPLKDLVRDICRPTELNGKRIRALRPWSEEDQHLFEAVSRGEFAINGFRNRDLQALFFLGKTDDVKERRRRTARISRQLRMLRAHGLIHKVPKTHRYLLTPSGTEIIVAILKTQSVSLQQLNKAAVA